MIVKHTLWLVKQKTMLVKQNKSLLNKLVKVNEMIVKQTLAC